MREQSALDGSTATIPPEVLRNFSFHYYESQPGVQYTNPVEEQMVSAMMDVIAEAENEDIDESVAFDLLDCVEEQLLTCSLWMSRNDPKSGNSKETPVYVQSPFGSVCSQDTEYSSTKGKDLSEEFYRCLADINSTEVPESMKNEVDDESDGWGTICKDAFQSLNVPETRFVRVVHRQLTSGFPPREVVILANYADVNYGPNP